MCGQWQVRLCTRRCSASLFSLELDRLYTTGDGIDEYKCA
jgi:hypothetical protein